MERLEIEGMAKDVTIKAVHLGVASRFMCEIYKEE